MRYLAFLLIGFLGVAAASAQTSSRSGSTPPRAMKVLPIRLTDKDLEKYGRGGAATVVETTSATMAADRAGKQRKDVEKAYFNNLVNMENDLWALQKEKLACEDELKELHGIAARLSAEAIELKEKAGHAYHAARGSTVAPSTLSTALDAQGNPSGPLGNPNAEAIRGMGESRRLAVQAESRQKEADAAWKRVEAMKVRIERLRARHTQNFGVYESVLKTKREEIRAINRTDPSGTAPTTGTAAVPKLNFKFKTTSRDAAAGTRNQK